MGSWAENTLSAAIMIAALIFLVFMVRITGTGHLGSYGLVAQMTDAAGLRVGTDVRISGVKVGRVAGLSLDAPGRKALVELRVRDDLALPADSTVVVSTPVMSDVALTITPGHATKTIPPGGRIPQWHAPAKPSHFTGS